MSGRPESAEVVARLWAANRTAVDAVGFALADVARAADAIAERLREGGRWFDVGAGTSGRLGVLDASELPPTFGIPETLVVGLIAGGDAALRRSVEGAEDDEAAGVRDLEAAGLTALDVVLGIAASGTTPYVLAAVAHARAKGALTLGLSCTPGTPLLTIVHVPLLVDVGPEVVRGSTRLKAGTAQKLVLNMLSTAALARLGLVWRDEMVAMRPTNSKLRARATRIVSSLLAVPGEEALRLLEEAAWSLPVALVCGRWGISPAQAARRLEATGNDVARALEEAP